ncbi:universal stress protein [Thalassomonas actiniarum]|uniref:Universal stress protein n=1 Tax=Thalassomonas actiniarum TaxID=485447 RepID=A0AAE9YZB3_9GAMM|nr:universal stress protein [Thalassomonas actiniarum]WDE02387.1 universal stress protein [Thalassomonas actiniarum]
MTRLHIIIEDYSLSLAEINKIALLQQAYAAELFWYAHAHDTLLDRLYLSSEFATLWQSFTKDVKQTSHALEQTIQQHFKNCTLSHVYDKYWQKTVDDNAEHKDLRIIIRGKHELSHSVLQYINHTDSSVIILGNRSWGERCKLIGAIDPFHSDDPKNTSDINVYKLTRRIAERFQSQDWKLLHSVYIPPLAVSHAKELTQFHKQRVYEFCRKIQCPSDHMAFCGGNPEIAIEHYAQMNKIDLIILGSRKHGIIDKWLNGSTIEQLVKKPELDILLAPANPVQNRRS